MRDDVNQSLPSAARLTLIARDREMFAKLRIPEELLADAGVVRVTDREAREIRHPVVEVRPIGRTRFSLQLPEDGCSCVGAAATG